MSNSLTNMLIVELENDNKTLREKLKVKEVVVLHLGDQYAKVVLENEQLKKLCDEKDREISLLIQEINPNAFALDNNGGSANGK